jgi:phage-related protein
MRQVAAWLYGDGKKQQLIFSDEIDLFYYGRLQNQIDLEQVVTFGEFTLQFRCEPFAYGVELAKDAYELNSPTLLYREIYPTDSYKYIKTPTSSQFFTLNNYGTSKAYPLLKITILNVLGRTEPIKITNQSATGFGTGNELSLTSFPADEIYIDMEKFMAYSYDTTYNNLLQYVEGTFWDLVSGNNVLKIEGLEIGESIEFIFRVRFL